jgi:restriction system protein
MKRLWLVRLGRHGEQEAHALETGELVLGFRAGDLTAAHDCDAVLKIVEQIYPDEKHKTQLHFAAQLNQFRNTMQKGDLVVVPLKTQSAIAIGEITGPYTPTAEGYPKRPVRWLKPDVPRDLFRQDLLYSFGPFMTVCEISRNDALPRVEAVLKTGRDPGYESSATTPPRAPASPETPTAEESEVDLDEIARDQIERRVASAFTGHDLTRFVAEILKAQGYVCRSRRPVLTRASTSSPGAALLALRPPASLFRSSRGNIVADQPTLQALIGAVQDTHAD